MFFKSLVLAGTASASCLHGLYKRAETVEVGKFGYEHNNGPLVWAGLAPENEACSTGTNQSPINLAVEFENLGTTIEVVVNGTTTYDNKQWALAQYHIHTPSEHRINREYSPLEIHMVHKGVEDPSQVAVVALLFEVSTQSSDPIIGGFTPSLSKIETPGTKTKIEAGIDFSSVSAHVSNATVLQYTGSLTTPPCSEGITFLVVQDPLKISVADFNAIKKVVKFNSRLTQNVIGSDNMIKVAGEVMAKNETTIAGLSIKEECNKNESVTTAEAATEAEGVPVPGSTLTISAIAGSPLPTPVLGLVQRRVERNSL